MQVSNLVIFTPYRVQCIHLQCVRCVLRCESRHTYSFSILRQWAYFATNLDYIWRRSIHNYSECHSWRIHYSIESRWWTQYVAKPADFNNLDTPVQTSFLVNITNTQPMVSQDIPSSTIYTNVNFSNSIDGSAHFYDSEVDSGIQR